MITKGQLAAAAERLAFLNEFTVLTMRVIDVLGARLDGKPAEAGQAFGKCLSALLDLFGVWVADPLAAPDLGAPEFTMADAAAALVRVKDFQRAVGDYDNRLGRLAAIDEVDPLTDEVIVYTEDQWAKAEKRLASHLEEAQAKLKTLRSL